MEEERIKKYLICVDSDGCVFDNMGIKWKECFIPNLIRYFELQPIAGCVREEAERINLYSSTRGINRYAGLPLLFQALEKRGELRRRHFNLPDITALADWISHTEQLSMESLKKEYERNKDVILERAILWSCESNKSIQEMIFGIPPFPWVRESFEKLKEKADLAVLSSANRSAIDREWSEHHLLPFTNYVCSQEMGSKKDCIRQLMEKGYDGEYVLMVGDAPGDYEAAKANRAAFYPIVPQKETTSWHNLYKEAADLFLEGKYGGREEQYMNVFRKALNISGET